MEELTEDDVSWGSLSNNRDVSGKWIALGLLEKFISIVASSIKNKNIQIKEFR